MKRILPLLLVLCLCVSTTGALAAGISAKGGFVMDADTGTELYNHNADVRRVPASMTKLMAAYVIYDAMEKGQIEKSTPITIGPALAAFSRRAGYSNVPLTAGKSYTLDELLGALFVVSANAAVMAIGDHLYGDEASFVARMNQFIADWGLDAKFYDCTGISAANYATPRAMATIANRLVTDYPDCLTYTQKTVLSFDGGTYGSTNKMLPGKAYAYAGTKGLKTGTTSAAGACFTGYTERDGVRLISVVMGAPYANGRYTDTIVMLDTAFEAYGTMKAQIEEQTDLGIVPEVLVNDTALPGFVYRHNPEVILIRVEDLAHCGFSLTYEETTNTYIVTNAPEKIIDGVNGDAYPEKRTVSRTKAQNVVLKNAEDAIGMYAETVYDAEGKAAIAVSELSYLGWVIQRGTSAYAMTR